MTFHPTRNRRPPQSLWRPPGNGRMPRAVGRAGRARLLEAIETELGAVYIERRHVDLALRSVLVDAGQRAIVAGMQQPVVVFSDGDRAVVWSFKP